MEVLPKEPVMAIVTSCLFFASSFLIFDIVCSFLICSKGRKINKLREIRGRGKRRRRRNMRGFRRRERRYRAKMRVKSILILTVMINGFLLVVEKVRGCLSHQRRRWVREYCSSWRM